MTHEEATAWVWEFRSFIGNVPKGLQNLNPALINVADHLISNDS